MPDPVIPIAFSSEMDRFVPPGAHLQMLAGPDDGLDGYVLAQRIEPGASGPPLHRHTVDQFYYVLGGEMTVQLGSDVFKASRGALVHLPPGTPHANWNTEAVDEHHMEFFVPGPPLSSFSTPAEARPTPGAEKLLRRLCPGEPLERAGVAFEVIEWPGEEARSLAETGAYRFFVILEGRLDVEIDRVSTRAEAHHLVMLKPGLALSARNPSKYAARMLLVRFLAETSERPAP